MDEYTLKDALKGGPGLSGYAYKADIYCVECGEDIIHDIYADRWGVAIPEFEFRDSGVLPQPIFFGGNNTERAVYCGECGGYLYGEDED